MVELADLAHKAVVAPPRRAESLASVLKVVEVAMIVELDFALFIDILMSIKKEPEIGA